MASSIKIRTSKYTGDSFAGRTAQELWDKLLRHIRENGRSLDGVYLDELHSSVKVTFSSNKNLLDLIDQVSPSMALGKSLIRTAKLNLEFDKATKGLKLSNKNVEEFPDYNEVTYSLTCNDMSIPKDSLFFHESALVNYMDDDFDKAAYDSCQYVLALVNYNVHKTYVNSTFETEESDYNETAFLCYDEASRKYARQDYSDTLNISSSTDISQLIDMLNQNDDSMIIPDRTVISDNDEMTYYQYSDVRVKKTFVKMIDQSPADVIRFFSFLSSDKQKEWIESMLRQS